MPPTSPCLSVPCRTEKGAIRARAMRSPPRKWRVAVVLKGRGAVASGRERWPRLFGQFFRFDAWSLLSSCVEAIIAAQTGDMDKAIRYGMAAPLLMDLADPHARCSARRSPFYAVDG